MPEYVFDMTVLSSLAATGRKDLHEDRYQRVAVTTAEVYDKLRGGLQASYEYLESALNRIQAASQTASCAL